MMYRCCQKSSRGRIADHSAGPYPSEPDAMRSVSKGRRRQAVEPVPSALSRAEVLSHTMDLRCWTLLSFRSSSFLSVLRRSSYPLDAHHPSPTRTGPAALHCWLFVSPVQPRYLPFLHADFPQRGTPFFPFYTSSTAVVLDY